jgi:trk system potassium uptake protein TrkH
MLPQASADGESTRSLDALFTAVSALCVTGLVVVDTQTHWSFFGEVVIAVLMQVGGLGYMVGTTMVLWVLGRRLGVRDQQMLRLYHGAPSMGEALSFARTVALFALVFEVAGIIALYLAFVAADVPASTSVWWAVFHSISAFNNAGFNITAADLNPFINDPAIILTITVLLVAGGIGSVPVVVLLRERSVRRLPLDSKLIFATVGALLVLGTLFIGVAEWNNEDTLGRAEPEQRPVVAFFQAATPRTAGFSAVDVASMSDESKFMQVGLMFIGGSAGSTAGGIKVGTFSVLFIAILATLWGREEIVGLGRRVPFMVIRQALTVALLFVAALFTLTVVLMSASDFAFLDVLFEAQSALSTVGLSTGITAGFGDTGRIALIVGMLVGRFGPLILVLEMTRPRTASPIRYPQDGIRLG